MTESDVLVIVSECIGVFGLGFGLGLFVATLKRSLDFL